MEQGGHRRDPGPAALPRHLDEKAVLLAIRPDKDVDCFHPFNVGQLMIGEAGFQPCTPAGVMRMLKSTGSTRRGSTASSWAAPISWESPGHADAAGKRHCNRVPHQDAEFEEECLKADILVAAAGRAGLISGDMVKEGLW